MTRSTTNSSPRARVAPAKSDAATGGAARITALAGPISELKPSSEQIRARAYQIYLERSAGGVDGDAASDWLRAEAELLRR